VFVRWVQHTLLKHTLFCPSWLAICANLAVHLHRRRLVRHICPGGKRCFFLWPRRQR
jgi:hypothetical protein